MNTTTATVQPQLPKCPMGIEGLDEITGGGLPRGRPTLICGSAGSGKTLFGLEFLARGATEFGEPGVFMAFEETAPELTQNVRSLGFDLDDLVAQKLLVIDHVVIDRFQIEETGEYDLEGLFIRLGYAIDTVHAKRVVLDTIETLFDGLSNPGIVRAELRRLFRWLKDKGVTAIVTGERGDATLTRHGLEEYVSDCVIVLDHRVEGQLATRRLRIVKYRGSTHGTNEYPFLIDRDGIQVAPITSLGLQREVSDERIPTGVAGLEEMLDGKGFYKGSSVLVSGSAGSGKTTLAAQFVDAACRRGERSLFFTTTASAAQLIRNLATVGIRLGPWVESGLLEIRATRPAAFGLEAHLVEVHRAIRKFAPHVIAVDQISSLQAIGTPMDVHAMLTRLLDYLKTRQITALFTDVNGAGTIEATDVEVSSIIDTWLLLRDVELGGERNRVIYVLKSRGMAHSNQLREFRLTPHGVQLQPPYIGPEGVLTGSARLTQEAQERALGAARAADIARLEHELARRREGLSDQLAGLRRAFATDEEELLERLSRSKAETSQIAADAERMAVSRNAEPTPKNGLTAGVGTVP